MAETYIKKLIDAQFGGTVYQLSITDVIYPGFFLLSEYEMDRLVQKFQEQKKVKQPKQQK